MYNEAYLAFGFITFLAVFFIRSEMKKFKDDPAAKEAGKKLGGGILAFIFSLLKK